MGKRYEGGKQKEFWIRGKKKGKRKKKEKKALGVGSLNYLFYLFYSKNNKTFYSYSDKRRTSIVEYRTLVNQIQSATRLL